MFGKWTWKMGHFFLIYLRYSWKILPLPLPLPTHAKARLQTRQAPLIIHHANTFEWSEAAGAYFQILTWPQEETVMIKNNNKIYKRQRAQPNEMQLECQRWSQQLAAAEAAVREVGLECIERYRGIESPPCKQSQYSANYLCHRRCVAEVALLLVSGEQQIQSYTFCIHVCRHLQAHRTYTRL